MNIGIIVHSLFFFLISFSGLIAFLWHYDAWYAIKTYEYFLYKGKNRLESFLVVSKLIFRE